MTADEPDAAAPSCHPERRRSAPESKDPDAEAGRGKDLSTPHGTRAHRCAAGPLARSCSAQDDNGGGSAETPALAWAIAAGLLPPDADAAAALTLGAAAELLRRYHGVFAPGENAEGTGAA